MEAIIFALISYFGWGSGDIFGTISSRKIGAYSTTFWVFAIAVILFSFYIPFAWNDLVKLNFGLFITLVMLGFLYIAGNISFNEAVRISNAPIAGSYPTFFVVLAFFVFKDPITRQQILGIITTLLGIILLSVLSV